MSHLKNFNQWLKELPEDRAQSGLPPRGLIAASLCVLERMKAVPSTKLADHLAKGQSQISGVSRSNQDRILAKYGETRVYTKEGGRTNRGNNDQIKEMLASIERDGFSNHDSEAQYQLLQEMQELLFEVVKKHFDLVKLAFDIPQPLSAHGCVSAILEAAAEVSKAGPVAQHLVAAKLKVRFPQLTIATFPVFAQDSQAGRKGDVVVNDMAIHVTVSPNTGHYKACRQNVSEGMLALLLVPSRKVDGTRQFLADAVPSEGIAVQGIEEFVAQNIGEIAEFSNSKLAKAIGSLLQQYNEIVDANESDKSLMIDIPEFFQ